MSFLPRKRKEREASVCQAKPSATKPVEPFPSNRLLAGYMAYEFLTRGTLLGEKFNPARAEAVQLVKSSGERKKTKPEADPSYAEVATILKTDGTHIPGIVNPTQLTRWIQM